MNTYHNNDSGGTVFTNAPRPPIDRVDRPSPGPNPGVSGRETHLRNGGERGAAE